MAEKEYIEREAALKIIDNYSKTVESDGKEIVKAVRDIVDFICPIADVQKVRHGKNVTPFHPADEFICSECGITFKDISEYIIEDDVYREFYFKFCPNCGAKMDKE